MAGTQERRPGLGAHREESPVLVLSRALEACGTKPLTGPEPRQLHATLRNMLRTLYLECGDEVRTELHVPLRFVAGRTPPRMARYHLARVLSERPGHSPDKSRTMGSATAHRRSWKPDDGVRGLLGDEDPSRARVLPPALAGGVLLLLAQIEVEEADTDPSAWRGEHNAYNVLQAVASDLCWPDPIRVVMRDVVAHRVPHGPDFFLRLENLARVARHERDGEAEGKLAPAAGDMPRKRPGPKPRYDAHYKVVERVLDSFRGEQVYVDEIVAASKNHGKALTREQVMSALGRVPNVKRGTDDTAPWARLPNAPEIGG